ncbi:MAG: DUF4336 domain-containing protein [Cyanobacteria bacterium P01_F01_bin.42]
MLTLTPHAENLWTASQPQSFMGLEIGTRMTVVRLKNQDLILISLIELEESDRQILEGLGRVRHLIAPNRFHHLHLGKAQTLFPEAISWGLAGLKEKRPDLQLDRLLDQPGSFEQELDYLPFEGYGAFVPWHIELLNETVFFHRDSRSLILTDAAFNFDESNSSVVQLAARALGSYKILKPTLFEKIGSREKEKVETSLRQVLKWDLDRVILTHGSVVESNGKDKLRTGYEWFLGKSLSVY